MTKLYDNFFPIEDEGQKFFIVISYYILPHEKSGKIFGNIRGHPNDIDSLEEAKKYVEEMMFENKLVEEAFILDKDKNIVARFLTTAKKIREVIW